MKRAIRNEEKTTARKLYDRLMANTDAFYRNDDDYSAFGAKNYATWREIEAVGASDAVKEMLRADFAFGSVWSCEDRE